MTRAAGAVAVVVVLAASFGLIGAAVLQTAQVLPRDVRLTLRQGLHGSSPEVEGRTEGGMDLIIVDGSPTGGARAVQVVVFGVLVGGVPVALTGMVLGWHSRVRHRDWSGGWSQVFLGAFVFQVSSLFVTALLFVGMLWAVIDLGSIAVSEAAFGGSLLISLGCSALALRSWGTLLHSDAERCHRKSLSAGGRRRAWNRWE